MCQSVCVCVCVCVELLKRSKTCTSITLAIFWQYMNLFRGAALTSGFSHVHLLIFLCLLKQFDPFCSTILAGGQSSLMLLCPTKLCIKEGSQGWSPWCTCYMIEFDMVNFVETLVMRVPSLVCVSSCCFPIRFHGTFIIMNLAQNVLYVLSKCVSCGGCPTRCHRAGASTPCNSCLGESMIGRN